MVRRNELACRNAWSASLWEPVSGAADAEQAQPRHVAASGPLPPASADDIRAVVSQDSVITDAGEDVLLSEARLIAEPVRPSIPSHHAVPPRPGPGFDPRTALFRAREAHREKTRARDAAARQSESIEPGQTGEASDDVPGSGTDAARIHLEGSGELEYSTDNMSSEPWEEVTPAPRDLSPAVYHGDDAPMLGQWLEELAPDQMEAKQPTRS